MTVEGYTVLECGMDTGENVGGKGKRITMETVVGLSTCTHMRYGVKLRCRRYIYPGGFFTVDIRVVKV